MKNKNQNQNQNQNQNKKTKTKKKNQKLKKKIYITENDRYKIEKKLKEKHTVPQIAAELDIKYNTLYKEIQRGKVLQRDTYLRETLVYKADYAQMIVDTHMSNRGRSLKIGADAELVAYIEKMIKQGKYSPYALLEQAKKDNLSFACKLCYKTIYNYLDSGLFQNISNNDLPYKKPDYRKKKHKKRKTALNNTTGRSIDKRPEHINDRDEYGHWEMDTVVSAKGTGLSCLLVLTERKTREQVIIKIPNRKAPSVVKALDIIEKQTGTRAFKRKYKTITVDNGVEFLNSAGIETAKYGKGNRTILYYCHPYSSFERGSNENSNRMIRRFFPKGANFDMVTNKQVKMVENWINNYPRKLHNGLSANEIKANQLLAA